MNNRWFLLIFSLFLYVNINGDDISKMTREQISAMSKEEILKLVSNPDAVHADNVIAACTKIASTFECCKAHCTAMGGDVNACQIGCYSPEQLSAMSKEEILKLVSNPDAVHADNVIAACTKIASPFECCKAHCTAVGGDVNACQVGCGSKLTPDQLLTLSKEEILNLVSNLIVVRAGAARGVYIIEACNKIASPFECCNAHCTAMGRDVKACQAGCYSPEQLSAMSKEEILKLASNPDAVHAHKVIEACNKIASPFECCNAHCTAMGRDVKACQAGCYSPEKLSAMSKEEILALVSNPDKVKSDTLLAGCNKIASPFECCKAHCIAMGGDVNACQVGCWAELTPEQFSAQLSAMSKDEISKFKEETLALVSNPDAVHADNVIAVCNKIVSPLECCKAHCIAMGGDVNACQAGCS